MLVRLCVLAILATMPATTPASAEADATPKVAPGDPNEKICETIPTIGSRLAKKRVCATRAEWAEQKRQDRQAVEQIQKQIGGPCSVVANKNTGGISC